MKIEIRQPMLEITWQEFELFYPLFNSGEKVLWYKEKEDKFILLTFIDNQAVTCSVLKEDIITWSNSPDNYPETMEKNIEEWKSKYLGMMSPKMGAYPFIRYGELE